jgi:hypothetical protein
MTLNLEVIRALSGVEVNHVDVLLFNRASEEMTSIGKGHFSASLVRQSVELLQSAR